MRDRPTIELIQALIDPMPFSEYDCALPPFGSPLRARWDALAAVAQAYAVVLGEMLLVPKDAPSIRVHQSEDSESAPAGVYYFGG